MPLNTKGLLSNDLSFDLILMCKSTGALLWYHSHGIVFPYIYDKPYDIPFGSPFLKIDRHPSNEENSIVLLDCTNFVFVR